MAKETEKKQKKSYCIIDDKKQLITFVADKITKKEQATIKNLVGIGYQVKRVALDELYPTEKLYSKENVMNFLKEQGKEAETEFKNIMDEPVIDKLTGNIKTFKNGKQRTKGYIGVLRWFRKNYDKEFKKYMAK